MNFVSGPKPGQADVPEVRVVFKAGRVVLSFQHGDQVNRHILSEKIK